ncbi:hypothetical protein Emag_000725 [Eimeria magna]
MAHPLLPFLQDSPTAAQRCCMHMRSATSPRGPITPQPLSSQERHSFPSPAFVSPLRVPSRSPTAVRHELNAQGPPAIKEGGPPRVVAWVASPRGSNHVSLSCARLGFSRICWGALMRLDGLPWRWSLRGAPPTSILKEPKMTPKGPPYGEGAPPSAAVWYEGPPQLTLPRMSPRPLGPTASLLHTPRCGPSSLDSGCVALLLEQLHKSPAAAKRAPLLEGPKTPRIDPTNSSSSSSSNSSSSRDFLLQVLADEIMPQFLADPSVQHAASVLLQQQSPGAFEQGGPSSLSLSGGPLSARGLSASPSPPPGGPRYSPDDEGPGGPPVSSAAGTPAGSPRECRASPSGRRVVGAPSRLHEGAPPEAREEFLTPVGAADALSLLVGPPDAADLKPSVQAGSDCLRVSPTQQAGKRGPLDGGPPISRSDSSKMEAETGAPTIEVEGPPGGRSEEASSVLAAVRAARDQRRLRAPPNINTETEETIDAAFKDLEGGMDLSLFRERIVGPLLGLGPFLAGPLFRRIDVDSSGVVTPEKLKTFWAGRFILRSLDPSLRETFPLPPLPSYRACCAEEAEEDESHSVPVIKRGSLVNFMGALSTRSREYIYPDDLRPWVFEVVECAPDMAFLLDPQSAEYLERYVDSVVARIMFYVDEESKSCISMKDLRRSSLVHVWCSLNPSTELSAVRKFFSYDHFYVFYYAFQELDEDEDFLLHRSDVCKPASAGGRPAATTDGPVATSAAAETAAPETAAAETAAPETAAAETAAAAAERAGVTLPKSLRFWFEIFDLDGDGFLRDHELEAAFEAQAERIRMRDGKSQTYEEFICQISDALGIPLSSGFSCRDLLRSPVAAGFLINCLLKCDVLRAFDEGEPVINLVQGTPIQRNILQDFTPFEIYAHSEYAAITAQRFEEHFDVENIQPNQQPDPTRAAAATVAATPAAAATVAATPAAAAALAPVTAAAATTAAAGAAAVSPITAAAATAAAAAGRYTATGAA